MSDYTVVAIGKIGHQISTCRDVDRARKVFNNCLRAECGYFTIALYRDGDLADILTRPAPFIHLNTGGKDNG